MSNRQPYRPAAERKADILSATVELLAERGPAAITLRQIAERAGVPHSLIVRHFGDKATLIRQATFGELIRWAEVVLEQDEPDAGVVAGFRYLCGNRVSGAALGLAFTGVARPQLELDSFPVLEAHAQLLVAAGMPPRPARDLALAAILMIASYVAAEDWWVTISQYHGANAPTRARRAIETQLRRLIDAGLTEHAGQRPST